MEKEIERLLNAVEKADNKAAQARAKLADYLSSQGITECLVPHITKVRSFLKDATKDV